LTKANRHDIIRRGEHVFIAGGTGSGKTFLASEYLRPYNHVVVLDTKGLFDNWNNMDKQELTICTRLSELPKVKTSKIIYRPVFQELEETAYNRFFEWIYKRKRTICLIDEAMQVSPAPLILPIWLRGCLQRGRQMEIGIWSLCQRPKNISPLMISEATHIFSFRLNLDQDREKLVEVTGCKEFLHKPEKYSFWYLNLFRDAQVARKGRLVKRRESL